MIALNNITVKFTSQKGSTHALDNINLTLEQGSFVTIIGKSGCGKSTLIHVMANLCQIDCGDMTFSGIKAPRVGVIFQEPRLMPWLTVSENVSFGLQYQQNDKQIIQQQVKNALQLVKLEQSESKYPDELSGGMKQRVSIARTMVTQPDLLLLDEPFSALDAFTKSTLQKELLLWWQQMGNTVVFVTHDIEEAILLGQRVIVMEHGKITEDLTVDLNYPREIDQSEVVKMRRYLFDKLTHHSL